MKMIMMIIEYYYYICLTCGCKNKTKRNIICGIFVSVIVLFAL